MSLLSTSPTELIIRPACRDDALVIYEFLCILEDSPLDQTDFLTVFYHNLAQQDIYYFVAELTDTIVGFVSCHVQYLLHHCGKVGEIQELFVRPDLRNQRIGQRLIEVLNKLAVQENFVNLEVTTNQKRNATVRFYEREGFTTTHFKLVKIINS